MTDFYKVIRNLSPDMTVAEIQKELLAQEGAWRRREISAPEKAQEMLVIINQAKKVFASPSSKAAYDRELEASQRKPSKIDPQAERYKEYKKWYGQALQYIKNQQFDLAKTAIERAFSYASEDSDDPWFYNDAAIIYRENHDYTTALNYANKAIVLDESEASFYITKGLVLYSQADDPNSYSRNREALINEAFQIFRIAVNKAEKKQDKESLGLAYSLMAHIQSREIRAQEAYYYQSAQIKDEVVSYEYATKAVKYGDPWNIGQSVLDCLDRIEKQRKRRADEEERRKREEERQKYEYENASAFDLVRESKKVPDPKEISKKEIQEFYKTLPVDDLIKRVAKTQYQKIRSDLSAQIELGKPYVSLEAFPEHHAFFLNEIREAFLETFPVPEYVQYDMNKIDGIKLFSYNRVEKSSVFTAIPTEYGKQFIKRLNALCKKDSILIGFAFLEYGKEETYIKLGSTVENPKKSSVFIIAIADEKLRKYAEGKGITLEELPKWSKTIDQFQNYVERGFRNTFSESGWLGIIILIAFVIVLGYLAFHLTGIAAVVCGIIDVLFIIGFAKGLLGL